MHSAFERSNTTKDQKESTTDSYGSCFECKLCELDNCILQILKDLIQPALMISSKTLQSVSIKTNQQRFWRAFPSKMSVVTFYAECLCSGGLWFEESWGSHAGPLVKTSKRVSIRSIFHTKMGLVSILSFNISHAMVQIGSRNMDTNPRSTLKNCYLKCFIESKLKVGLQLWLWFKWYQKGKSKGQGYIDKTFYTMGRS